MKYAERMANLGTETAFEVLAKAKKLEAEGKHIIHLEIGEPDFPLQKIYVMLQSDPFRQEILTIPLRMVFLS